MASSRKFIINDTNSSYSSIKLSSLDNTNQSCKVYLIKDIKSINNKEKEIKWVACGDSSRIYFFIGSKNNPLSQTQVYVMGEVWDYFKNEWCNTAIGSITKDKASNTGSNLAFSYPSWSIDQSTGYLICKPIKEQFSDSEWKSKNNNLILSYKGHYDLGYHIYPIDIPHTNFTPIEE